MSRPRVPPMRRPDEICSRCQPMGASEVAELLGVERTTVNQWNYRGLLPDPDWIVHGYPAWDRLTIERWAQLTGRGRRPAAH